VSGPAAFAAVSHLTVGDFRDWLLSDAADGAALAALAPGLTPEMAAAVSKIMRNQDLILAARKCRATTRFNNTIGLPGTMAVRLQPNHPTDDPAGIVASILDGLLYGCGDAVIGVNPASDSVQGIGDLLRLLDEIIRRFEIPTQGCVLTHVTTTLQAIERGAPVDLVFQSIAGTEAANASFGVTLDLLAEARDAALGHEAVVVSHQLPVWMARCAFEGRRYAHDPRKRQCALASVTSVTYAGERVQSLAYAEPSADLLGPADTQQFGA